MATVNTTDPKPGFVYNADDDTWYPLLGISVQSLDALTDVVITSPATNQSLVYNGTNWVNSTEVGDISGVTAGTGLSGGGTSGTVTVSIDTSITADLTTAQTLTNKTLTSPATTGGTISDAVIKGLEEDVNVVASAATGTINFDVTTASVWYYTSNATANHTLNFRYSSGVSLNTALAVGDAITLVWLNTNGVTPYYPSTIQIDGTTVTPKVPSAITGGNASSIDAYSFTIIKTANATFTVLESQTKFA
jgi:trimeric autotransporter adhesin